MKKIIKMRRIKEKVRELEIEFDEKYCIDEDSGEEIYDRDMEIENDIVLYDIYKKQKNLLTTCEIKNIRNKYGLNQKEFAFSLGLGEITIHRLENGTIQSESIDSIIRLSDDPLNMKELLTKNSESLSNECYVKTMRIVNRLILLKEHKLAQIKYNEFVCLDFKPSKIEDVTALVISKYNDYLDNLSKVYGAEKGYITHLKLQKLLYFVQGIALAIFKEKAFDSKIVAWSFGPVVEDVWNVYKDNGKEEIKTRNKKTNVSKGLEKIIESVVASYGKIDAYDLIRFTHDEDPWINTKKDEEIEIKKIQEYFKEVYDIFN